MSSTLPTPADDRDDEANDSDRDGPTDSRPVILRDDAGAGDIRFSELGNENNGWIISDTTAPIGEEAA
jgi:hypothetical protein